MKIAEIRQANKKAGFRFFERATMRFFKTKVVSEVFGSWFANEAFFVTSETRPDGVTRYTVRRFDCKTGAVETVGEFQQFTQRSAAVHAMKMAYQTSEVSCGGVK